MDEEEAKNEIESALNEVFPHEAEFNWIPEGLLEVTWPLPSPARPHKKSRPILIRIGEGHLSDYCNLGNISRNKFDDRLREWVTKELKAFNPNHDTPIDQVPTLCEWDLPKTIFG